MSRKNKQVKHKYDFREILSNLVVTDHFKDQLRMRFQVEADEFDFGRLKIGNSSVNHPTLRNKIMVAKPNIFFAFSSALNLIIPVDMTTKTAITALYLDGRDGYNI